MNTMSHKSILETGRYRELSITGVDPEIVRKLHRFMLRLRRLEEAIKREYHPADEMRCPVHLCVGQEAVPAALSLLLDPEDCLFSHHRSHGYFLAKSAPMKALLAELYGRETGANGGKAGSQDISMSSANFYSGAILAGSVAIAVGAGLGFQMKKVRNIAAAGFGEGATEEGIFWEAISYAALKRLPVVFLCENNVYATYAHQLKHQLADNLTERVGTFGVNTCSVFGNDVVAVYSAVARAVSEAREGKGPWFIQAYTYRWYGHVGPEDDDYIGYRTKSEVESWKANCPIALLEERLFEAGTMTESTLHALVADIDAEISEAFRFAKDSPVPDDPDWTQLNYSASSPVADRLLGRSEPDQFDQNQDEAIPGPY